MALRHKLAGADDTYQFEARVDGRPEAHFTPRIRVREPRLNLPLEDDHILWYR